NLERLFTVSMVLPSIFDRSVRRAVSFASYAATVYPCPAMFIARPEPFPSSPAIPMLQAALFIEFLLCRAQVIGRRSPITAQRRRAGCSPARFLALYFAAVRTAGRATT